MEFLFFGGIISIPLIYYSTRPLPPDASLEKQEEKEEDTVQEFLTQEELENMRKRSKERQNRILSALTPKEQELFKDYITSISDPEQSQSSTFHRGVD